MRLTATFAGLFCLAATAQAAAGGEEPSSPRQPAEPRAIETKVGRVVTLRPPVPAGAGARWVQLSGPDVLLKGATAPGTTLSLTVRTNGAYRLAFLPGRDAGLLSSHVFVLETEEPAMRKTVVTGPHRAPAGEKVTLQAALETRCACAVTNPRSRWKQVAGPKLRLTRADISREALRFRPESPGFYSFIVSGRCGCGWTPWAVHAVEVPARADGRPERRPVAAVAPVSRAYAGTEVLLDGSRSRDPDGDPLVYRWFQASGPAAGLEGEGARVGFTPPAKGDYAFTLTVEDPAGFESSPAVVTFTALPPPDLARPDPGAADPLDRPFSIRLENRPLSDLFTRLSDAGVTIRASAEVTAERPFDKVTIDLWAVDMPVRKVLDWVGRALDAFYVIEEPGAVWFARDTKWLEREKPVAETFRIDAVHSEPDASDLGALLAEAVRAATWADPAANLGKPDAVAETVTAILPRSAQVRLAKLLAELRREVPSGPPPPGGNALALARATERPVRARYRDWPARDIAWDLARQARLPVGFLPLGAEGGARISVELGDGPLDEVPLARALDALSRAAGFAGWRVEPPGAVWLYRGAPPPLTSECTWSAAEVRGYDTRMLESAHGFAGPMLVHLVRTRCVPDRWRDPFSAVGYSRIRRRLVVIHVREVQLEVAALLDRLAREGRKALEADEAPVDEAPVEEAPGDRAAPGEAPPRP